MRQSASVARGRLLVGVVAAGLIAHWPTALAGPPMQVGLSPAQQNRLKELGEQAEAFRAQDKLADAIKALKEKLQIEQEVLGDTHDSAIKSLDLLVILHEENEDWESAKATREELIEVWRKTFGEHYWKATDGRWELEHDFRWSAERFQGWAKLDGEANRKLREAARIDQRVERLWNDGVYGDAEKLARKALGIRAILAISAPRRGRKLAQLGCDAVLARYLRRGAWLLRAHIGNVCHTMP